MKHKQNIKKLNHSKGGDRFKKANFEENQKITQKNSEKIMTAKFENKKVETTVENTSNIVEIKTKKFVKMTAGVAYDSKINLDSRELIIEILPRISRDQLSDSESTQVVKNLVKFFKWESHQDRVNKLVEIYFA